MTQPYDFSSQVLSSFTLYAKWTAESGTYTVTFNSNGGSAVPAQTVKAGEKAVKPANPTKSGYSFSGWYSDASLITQYDFNSAVNADITLCAKWTSNGGGGGGGPVTPTTYTVTFCNNNETYATVSGITSGTSLGDKMP
ncbi:InlB B-repeat-containing protein, partial [Candidatus Methanomassiliicoccus intestinalis]|uniref:InlB B-repeat-containing protein n=1 Tax=Candidatus Methanomassiliicoccus intestinalis TaxID=1406512 RepID=UPI0037DC7A68